MFSSLQSLVTKLKHWILKKREANHHKNLKVRFRQIVGYPLNLDNPRTFNEKINWLKFYYQRPVLTQITDKYTVRDYLNNKGFGSYLNELYGVYKNLDDFLRDLDQLPQQFVVKPNHWSGEYMIVKDKSNIDRKHLEQIFGLLKRSYYNAVRCEWMYKDIKPMVLVEKYLENKVNGILDYKIYCFGGQPIYTWLPIGASSKEFADVFYDNDWNMRPFHSVDKKPNSPQKKGFPKPSSLNEMLSLSRELSKDFPFMRVDLYDTGERIVFGELTLYDSSGMSVLDTEEDMALGDLIELPSSKIEVMDIKPEDIGLLSLAMLYLKNLFSITYILVAIDTRLRSKNGIYTALRRFLIKLV